MATKKASAKTGLSYHGKNLTRKDNLIFLGNPEDKFFVQMTALESENIGEISVSTKVSVALMEKTEENVTKKVKSVEREGLFAAVDIASIWLEDALSEE